MKKIITNLLFLAISSCCLAQNLSPKAWAYKQLATNEITTASVNFKEYWCDLSSTLIDSENDITLGFIGTNYQRMKIKFTKVVRDKKNILNCIVSGKSLVKKNLVSFTGTITVEKVAIITRGNKESYLAVLKYKLIEDKTQKSAGVFEGYGVINFNCDEGGANYNTDEEDADGFYNNQFVGTWIANATKVSKPCNWGDFRIPQSGDLDAGAGEFTPNYKYLKYGWQSLYNKIINLSTEDEALEKKKWW